MGVTIILPAHNEERIIKQAIESLLNQSYWETEIIVCLDNCTDKTEAILNNNFGDNYAVKIFKSVNNQHKKAGALNQLFSCYFSSMRKYILVMDADTVLHHRAVEEGVRYLKSNNKHGAVCSIAGIMNPEKKNLLWYLQSIEYGFGDTSFIENRGNVFVCRGMYSMYRKAALNTILDNRGFIYDQNSITEDYELTLELKKYNWEISSYTKIKAFTDVPIKFKDFWVQRVRWMKGGVEDLIKHGIKKHTKNDIIGSLFYRFLIIVQIYFLIEIFRFKEINVFWTAAFLSIYLLNIIVRFKYVRNKDFKTYLIAFSLIPIMLYGMLDMILTIYTTFLGVLKVDIKWR